MYVDAAVRAREAGFDIIYVYGAHSYLPLQFLSPFYNKRTDKYGGSFENRARFWKECLEQVQEAVGDDCAIASRFAVDTLYGPSSIEIGEDGVRFVEHVDDLVDLWDLTVGDIAEWGQNAGPSRFFEENHEKPYTGQVKAGRPHEQAGGRRGADHQPRHDGRDHPVGPVRHHRRRAPVDLRPLPPEEDRGGPRRRHPRVHRLQPVHLALGDRRPADDLHPERHRRRGVPARLAPREVPPGRERDKGVLVVGAGPAGMECAMVLGKRDMSAVHLVDAEKEIGGCVNWISLLGHSDGKENLARGTARGLGEWKRIVNYRQIQLDKLKNVEVHTNSRLSTQDVLEYGAEIVVVATGCHFATDGLNPATHAAIEGADTSLDWQLTPDEVVEGEQADRQARAGARERGLLHGRVDRPEARR